MPVPREGVDLEPALVGGQHLLAVHVDRLNSLVDPDDVFKERDAIVDARAGAAEDSAGLPNWTTTACFGFRHDGERGDGMNRQQDRNDAADQRALANEVGHWPAPFCCCDCFWTSGSGSRA